jgi:hypothetical protein
VKNSTSAHQPGGDPDLQELISALAGIARRPQAYRIDAHRGVVGRCITEEIEKMTTAKNFDISRNHI